jgi:hypothetical protein
VTMAGLLVSTRAVMLLRCPLGMKRPALASVEERVDRLLALKLALLDITSTGLDGCIIASSRNLRCWAAAGYVGKGA